MVLPGCPAGWPESCWGLDRIFLFALHNIDKAGYVLEKSYCLRYTVLKYFVHLVMQHVLGYFEILAQFGSNC